MLYITGDVHGNQKEWFERTEKILRKDDIIVVNGDFGIGFWKGEHFETEEAFYDFLEKQAYTVLFIDGNHENFDQLNNYAIEIWCNGRVHKIRKNVIHLMRGEVYHIEGYKIFVMGGGASIDKERRIAGVSWWKEEMPTESDYFYAFENLEKEKHQIDYILTHTAPSESIYYLSLKQSLGIKGSLQDELPLNYFLDVVQQKVRYQHWYFGHFHIDLELWRGQTAIFRTVRELASGKIVYPESESSIE